MVAVCALVGIICLLAVKVGEWVGGVFFFGVIFIILVFLEQDYKKEERKRSMNGNENPDSNEGAEAEQAREESRDNGCKNSGDESKGNRNVEFKGAFQPDITEEREIEGESRDGNGGGNNALVHKLEGVVTLQTIEKDGEEERISKDKSQCHVTLEFTTSFGDEVEK